MSTDHTLTKTHLSTMIDLEIPVAYLQLMSGTELNLDEIKLAKQRDSESEQTWSLDQSRMSIGSLDTADIKLIHPTISRQHAYIEMEERGYRLIDRDSKNGVFINQVRVLDALLSDGDLIRVGEIHLVFRVQKEQAKALQLWSSPTFGELYGQSTLMRELFALLYRVSQSDINVLIEGESGTGKELAARAIHQYSQRSSQALVVFDCSSVPTQLIESELFGHVKGSFTGATEHRQGAFLKANGGTLFLDEIGELPLELQPKLLRALERNEIKAVGADSYTSVNVRIISATHRKLDQEVEQKSFRLDLFYRLTVVKVLMPALRKHREDIPGLVDRMIQTMASSPREVSYKTMNLLMQHEWLGNVRELKNYVQKAIALSSPEQKTLETQFILPHELEYINQAQSQTDSNQDSHFPNKSEIIESEQSLTWPLDLSREFKDVKSDLIDQFERVYWGSLMQKYENNISAAARAAGIHRKSAEYIVKKLGLRSGDDHV